MPAVRIVSWQRWAGLATMIAMLGCGGQGTRCPAKGAAATLAVRRSNLGFVVAAADRDVLGNEETRAAYRGLAVERSAELVILGGDGTQQRFDAAVSALAGRGARRIVVLPLFVAAGHPQMATLRHVASRYHRLNVQIANPFGDSYLAVEALTDRLRAIDHPAGRRLIVLGYGADTDAASAAMAQDYQRLVAAAIPGFDFESARVVVAREMTGENPRAEVLARIAEAGHGGQRVVIVPFCLGPKLDSMMSFTSALTAQLPANFEMMPGEVTPHPAVAIWMKREANRHASVSEDALGVVVLADGSDPEQNETMRHALAAIERKYLVEYAFSLAEQPVVESAVRRLERRGARWIVIVRVFGLESSFRSAIERMIGLDIERGQPAAHTEQAHQHRAHDLGHQDGAGAPPTRIRSSAWMTTVGGFEAQPLFAKALLDRATALSERPARETVILVAHGSGDDAVKAPSFAHGEGFASHPLFARWLETQIGRGVRALRNRQRVGRYLGRSLARDQPEQPGPPLSCRAQQRW
jgi:sirohydrochlorin ferrochelatase